MASRDPDRTAGHHGPGCAEDPTRVFLRGSGGSVAVRIAAGGLLFASQAVFARLLGVESFGIYVLAYAWLNILLIAGRQGFDVATVRYVATYRGQGEWGRLRGFLRFSNGAVAVSSLCVAGLLAAGARLFAGDLADEALAAFWLAAATLPLYAFLQTREAAIRGLGLIVRPQILYHVVHPALLIVGLPTAVLIFGAPSAADTGMAVYLAATALVLIGLWATLRSRLPVEAARADAQYAAREWLGASAAMMFLMSFGPILNQVSIVLIGALDGNQAAGTYGAAVRIANVLQLVIAAQNATIAPMIANLHAGGDRTALARVIRLSVRLVFAASLAVIAVLVLFGKPILLLLGEDFLPAYPSLIVLLGGQLVFAACGPAALLLNMTGGHAASARIIFLCALLNVALAIALIPQWGALGAAAGTAATLAVWSGLMVRASWRRLGVLTLVTLPLPARRRGAPA